jgi:hypothetical protein
MPWLSQRLCLTLRGTQTAGESPTPLPAGRFQLVLSAWSDDVPQWCGLRRGQGWRDGLLPALVYFYTGVLMRSLSERACDA